MNHLFNGTMKPKKAKMLLEIASICWATLQKIELSQGSLLFTMLPNFISILKSSYVKSLGCVSFVSI